MLFTNDLITLFAERHLKRVLWLLVIFLLLSPQSGALGSSTFQPEVALFPNRGFESDPTNPSNGWDWPNGDWIWDGNIAHESTHSARVSRTTGSETASIYSAYLPIQPSTTIYLVLTGSALKMRTKTHQSLYINIQPGIRRQALG